ncbi:Pre-mRNA-splicing factor CLF1 [Dissostichus eleginoides]|uniref:Pre-mRNA-splicing factor CLF1 n=1 Tax=Dissostichus eleginoides TaxID=100907 RepID=A0AAD9B234_DISEL|nr:Pre-mRNA-splicing factor CLF1 [Dissostichus eleginoides]
MSSDTPPRPQKRKHRQQKYRREWEEANQWLDRVPEDDYKANCKACRRTFSVSHGGLSDVKQHAAGDLHSRNIRTQRSQAPVSQFFIAETSPEIDSITAAEVTQVYHTVKHNLSYNSADCGHKLNQKTLSDSKMVKKMTLGRTKQEALVKDVLAPKAVGDVLKILTSPPLPFSIQTDASNKGNRKMFPLAVQYFTPESGVTNKMLDFIENPDESAAGIVALLEQSLEKFGLSMDQVTAFSADNTNVNYGIHNSVFTNLKRKQNDLLRGNCHAHIVHNTVKHALDKLTVDVENVVLKVYGHFSISAKRRESLKEFCEFCDVEFQEILRHVTTRWLSLNPAIHRLMQTWTALKSYFISLGDECPKQVQALLKLNRDSTVEDEDIVEIYLLFCNNILSLFEEVVKSLESNRTTCVELYSIMDEFRQKLIQRRDNLFYGYLTRQKLQRLLPHDAHMARAEFTAFLNTAISYVEKWFDFSEENWLFSLQPLLLQHGNLTFNQIEKVATKLNLINKLKMNELYDECTTANTILRRLREEYSDAWKSKGVAARWMAVFKEVDVPNMLSIMRHILSIPASTGYVERIFSRMTNKWSDCRSRCSVELIRSELLITLNFEQTCPEFHTTALKDKELLSAARSNKKYSWKKK